MSTLSKRLRGGANLLRKPAGLSREDLYEAADELDRLTARVAELEKTAAAWKWGYEYLQDRMESIDRHGWAHDCDDEITYRCRTGA